MQGPIQGPAILHGYGAGLQGTIDRPVFIDASLPLTVKGVGCDLTVDVHFGSKDIAFDDDPCITPDEQFLASQATGQAGVRSNHDVSRGVNERRDFAISLEIVTNQAFPREGSEFVDRHVASCEDVFMEGLVEFVVVEIDLLAAFRTRCQLGCVAHLHLAIAMETADLAWLVPIQSARGVSPDGTNHPEILRVLGGRSRDRTRLRRGCFLFGRIW